MKKIILPLFILLLSFLFTQSLFAQEFDAKKAYEDFLFKLDVYRKENTDFQNAKNFYLQSQTLNLKEKTRKELFDVLVARDELISVYLTALRLKLHETPDHPGNEKGDMMDQLLEQSPWYLNHKNIYNQSEDSLETLLSKSHETDRQYQDLTSPVMYKVLATIAYSKYIDYKIEHENIYKSLRQKIDAVELSQKPLFDRWIRDIDIEFQKVTDYEIEAKAIRTEFSGNKRNKKPFSIYNDFLDTLDGGKASFLAINGYLTEMQAALSN